MALNERHAENPYQSPRGDSVPAVSGWAFLKSLFGLEGCERGGILGSAAIEM